MMGEEERETIGVLVTRAEELAKGNDWGDSAIAVNRSILDRDPQNLNACRRLVTCYSSHKDFANVRIFCERILQIDPRSEFAKRRLIAIDAGREDNIYSGRSA